MIRFLVDVSAGKAIEDFLIDRGYDSRAVRIIDNRMSDSDIVRLAVSEKRMILTMDKDFGELVYHNSMGHCGVLLLRLEDEGTQEKLRVMEEILDKFSTQIEGAFCVYQKNRLRIRKNTVNQ